MGQRQPPRPPSPGSGVFPYATPPDGRRCQRSARPDRGCSGTYAASIDPRREPLQVDTVWYDQALPRITPQTIEMVLARLFRHAHDAVQGQIAQLRHDPISTCDRRHGRNMLRPDDRPNTSQSAGKLDEVPAGMTGQVEMEDAARIPSKCLRQRLKSPKRPQGCALSLSHAMDLDASARKRLAQRSDSSLRRADRGDRVTPLD